VSKGTASVFLLVALLDAVKSFSQYQQNKLKTLGNEVLGM
jgi:hypothetical protein